MCYSITVGGRLLSTVRLVIGHMAIRCLSSIDDLVLEIELQIKVPRSEYPQFWEMCLWQHTLARHHQWPYPSTNKYQFCFSHASNPKRYLQVPVNLLNICRDHARCELLTSTEFRIVHVTCKTYSLSCAATCCIASNSSY